MRMAIISMETTNVHCYTMYSILTKERYAQKWGYDFINQLGSLNTNRHIFWTKILALLNYITKYDYLFWIDGDAAIMNMDIDFKSLLLPEKDFIFATDVNGINAGVFIVRCTPYAKEVLEKVYSMTEFDSHLWKEQAAFVELYNTDPKVTRMTGILPKRKFNSYLDDYEPGDFILHLPGVHDNRRVDIFSNLIAV